MFAAQYLAETAQITADLNATSIELLVEQLLRVRSRGGRVFVLGLGGSAANAQHCANDLRVRGRIDAYVPDLAEWTARANDQGWAIALKEWLKGSHLGASDAVLILSGSGESLPLIMAARYAQTVDATRLAILGNQGSIGNLCHHVVTIPCPGERRAGHAEAFQAVVWHCVVAHPRLAI
jgi:D-sedoheptulose 7-phosphate isomerase